MKDETGVSIVHKPGKVIAQLGWKHVYTITSAEKRKTRTVLSCVLSIRSGIASYDNLSEEQKIPECLKEGFVPNTLFANSANGWINGDLYIEWFKFFLKKLPPARPVLLVHDGHSLLISIELIENNVHLLCLPSHTTHILQPLDVEVFISFKSNFSKSCQHFLAKHPGQVITTDSIASLICDAWYPSLSPLNIMSGFRKCCIHPFNTGEVSDRQLAPSQAVTYTSQSEAVKPVAGEPSSLCDSGLFTPEQRMIFERQFQEGYDIKDPESRG